MCTFSNRNFEENSSVAESLEEESAFEIAESLDKEVPDQSTFNISLEIEEVSGQLNMDYHEESEYEDEGQAVTDKVSLFFFKFFFFFLFLFHNSFNL